MNQSYWSPLARQIEPYTPGEQPKIDDLIKLNTNENPYPPSPKVISAIQNAANASLRLYPHPESNELCSAIAQRHGVKPEQVFAGNGSDEVLALAFLAYFCPDAPISTPDVTYSFYPVYARLFGMPMRIVPLNQDFSLPVESFFGSAGGVIFPNPNAPTGMAISIDEIIRICKGCDRAVIIDEAYVEFGAQSAVTLIDSCPNLVVIKTFSKSHSLAGLRIGYAIACRDMIAALENVKNSFNSYPLDRVAQAAAKAAILDDSYCSNVLKKIIETREEYRPRLASLGFNCLPSNANFVLAEHESLSAEYIQQQLRERAVLVRRFNVPRIDNMLRITIGTDAEMDRLVYCLGDILKG